MSNQTKGGEMKSKIILKGLQIKSLNKAQKLAKSINTIEEECGICNVEIILKDCFVCPWVDVYKLDQTPMEELLRDILIKELTKP